MQAVSILLAEVDPTRSWSLFLEHFLDTLARAARRCAPDREEADDLTVEVLEKWAPDWPAMLDRYRALDPPEPGREEASFRAWLAVVARNAVIDCRRARHGRRRQPAAVLRSPAWLQDAFRAVCTEGQDPMSAWETLRARGAFSGDFGEFSSALAELSSNIRKRPDPPQVHAVSDVEQEADPTGSTGSDPVEAEGIKQAFQAAVEDLSGEERRLLRAYYLERVPVDQLVRALGGKTVSQVYNRVHNVLKKLRAAVEVRGIGVEDLDVLATFDWHAAVGPAEMKP